MNGNAFLNMARVGFVFSFDLARGVTFVAHNSGRDVTDFDVKRIGDVYPDAVAAPMDDGKRVVVLH